MAKKGKRKTKKPSVSEVQKVVTNILETKPEEEKARFLLQDCGRAALNTLLGRPISALSKIYPSLDVGPGKRLTAVRLRPCLVRWVFGSLDSSGADEMSVEEVTEDGKTALDPKVQTVDSELVATLSAQLAEMRLLQQTEMADLRSFVSNAINGVPESKVQSPPRGDESAPRHDALHAHALSAMKVLGFTQSESSSGKRRKRKKKSRRRNSDSFSSASDSSDGEV